MSLVAEAMDPGTGVLLQDETGQNFKRGNATLERVIRVLRTPRGQCVLDPSYGVDMSFVDKAHPDLAARWQAAVIEALRPEVEARAISDVSVIVDAVGGHLLYSVSFVDVRERERRTIGNLQVR